MHAALLIDIGSTFTKTCAIDLEPKKLIAPAVSPATVKDRMRILERALCSKKEPFSLRPEDPKFYGNN
jgi:hypothetical protein